MKNGFNISGDSVSVDYIIGDRHTAGLCGDHCHDKYEITYLISTSGRYIVEGSEHKVTRGTLVFLSPMSYHNVTLELDAKTEAYTVYFSKRAIPQGVVSLLDRLFEGVEARGLIFDGRLISEPLADCFERFSLCDKLSEGERDVYIGALLSEIIVLLSAAQGERMRASEDELGARVARYVNQNIHKNLSLERLARRFFVSKYYLCRAFKGYSGISLHAYINQKRIIYAKQLIESGATASDAAERVGFGDYSAFYRAYVKIVGHSPAAEHNS